MFRATHSLRVANCVLAALVIGAVLAGCSSPRKRIDSHLQQAARALEQQKIIQGCEHIDAAIAEDRKRDQTYLRAIDMLDRARAYEDAAGFGDDLLAIKRIDRSFSLSNEAALNLRLANLYKKGGNYPAAERAYLAVLDQYPDDPRVLNDLGYLYIQESKFDKALRLTKRASEMAPKDGEIMDSLGWAQYAAKDYRSAVQTLAKASRLSPNQALIHYHLGVAYEKVGLKPQARAELSRALKLDSKMTDARKRLQVVQP